MLNLMVAIQKIMCRRLKRRFRVMLNLMVAILVVRTETKKRSFRVMLNLMVAIPPFLFVSTSEMFSSYVKPNGSDTI